MGNQSTSHPHPLPLLKLPLSRLSPLDGCNRGNYPKARKTGLFDGKAYHPVSLLECYGKLLEKVVANRFVSDINHFNLLGPSQFRSRPYHSTIDACSLLKYKAQMMTQHGRIGGVLLCDISCFFDHLNPKLTECILTHLGICSQTCTWV